MPFPPTFRIKSSSNEVNQCVTPLLREVLPTQDKLISHHGDVKNNLKYKLVSLKSLQKTWTATGPDHETALLMLTVMGGIGASSQVDAGAEGWGRRVCSFRIQSSGLPTEACLKEDSTPLMLKRMLWFSQELLHVLKQ